MYQIRPTTRLPYLAEKLQHILDKYQDIHSKRDASMLWKEQEQILKEIQVELTHLEDNV